MKINRFLIIFFVAVTTMLVSCEEYEDSVEPSPAVSADMNVVTFPAGNTSNFEFSPLDTEFDITVSRTNTSGALEVPLTVLSNTDDSFTVPSSVSFAAGEETATITITINYDNAPLGQELELALKVDDAYYNPYKEEYGKYYASVKILEWQKYANGTYESGVFGVLGQVDLYKLKDENKYRIFDVYADGHHLTFGWEGEASLTWPDYSTDADGYYVWETGAYVDGYGYFWVALDASPSYTFYDAGTSTFQIEGYWTATDNSEWGGWIDDYFTIETLY